MRTKIITIFADAGHAWAKVTKKDLIALGIADKISPYSYQTKSCAYLEEDSDLSIYREALELKGINYQFRTKYAKDNKRSHVRNYQSYSIN